MKPLLLSIFCLLCFTVPGLAFAAPGAGAPQDNRGREHTGISGTVLDAYGKPVAGALVVARNAATADGPVFVADGRTGKDGQYRLSLPEGGRYLVRVKGNRLQFAAEVKAGAVTEGININPSGIPGPRRAPAEVGKEMAGVCGDEDFATTVAGRSGCLVMREYGFSGPSSPRTLVVWLHGDLSDGGPANYHFPLAEQAATEFAAEKVLSIALVRPGYQDGAGNYSAGDCYRRLDTYTRENITEIGAAIERLRQHFKPERLFLVGDSGGAAIAAVLLGMQPKLAEGAILVGCPCDLVRWRGDRRPWTASENPLNWADRIDPAASVIVLTGADDSNTVPVIGLYYADVLKTRGVRATFRMIPDTTHEEAIASPAVTAALRSLLR
ncbi:hypothetical protein GURASL_32400 [Geotalea uraniireducens]|uniref:Peptidase S9 prolyl oligopeptidase catalytic domain-containing protein n=1 Tax=Geotalea uraniireducens TaxID=351604 RepID=A0ABM8ENZ7_9BACT|nr:carboxypeptidase regulatory-like domain-containing protein [Geotalea uraniireducens]BDV44317.1 hypothetical protein GURASL_32400 [Geotalea uraniireducens]